MRHGSKTGYPCFLADTTLTAPPPQARGKLRPRMSRAGTSGMRLLARASRALRRCHVARIPVGPVATCARSFTCTFENPTHSTRPLRQPRKACYSTLPSSSLQEDFQSTLRYNNLATPASIATTHFDLSRIPSSERAQILRDFILVPDYLSTTEHDMLVYAATKKLKRALGKQVRYEDGHFDGVITRYRECSATDWGAPAAAAAATASTGTEGNEVYRSTSSSSSPTSSEPKSSRPKKTTPGEVMYALKQEFFPHDWNWVAPHILELESGKGGIKPHVDHLDASGEVVAGLCLGSTAVMELIHDEDPGKQFRVLLPKGCFYFQRGQVRYHYKHGIPIELEDHAFKGMVIPKEKRISVMLRNALEPSRRQNQSSRPSGFTM